MRRRGLIPAALLIALGLAAAPACRGGNAAIGHANTANTSTAQGAAPWQPDAASAAFLDTLERRTFDFFWERSDSLKGLTPDRWPAKSFVSVSAVGFALTAYPIGVEHGWVSRRAALERVTHTLDFFWRARQDSARTGVTGYHGFFYHFVDPASGERFENVELSTIDTALLLAGVLFCQSYFDRTDAAEAHVRAVAESLYARTDFRWMQVRPPAMSLAWTPEEGFMPYDWGGYNETMILMVLALGSPTHACGADAWSEWTKHYRWGTFYGQQHLGFAPLFGHQYSHIWLDLRGIRDAAMREHDLDYFENSRRATLAQRAYAIANPGGFAGYGADLWGLSACDGPIDSTLELHGHKREFHTYDARGASFVRIGDDGTVAPTAAGGSIAFTPEISIPMLEGLRARYGENVFGRYGFVDALNPTLDRNVPVWHGRVVPGVGWFDTDYLGIDEGPIIAMIENYRSGLVWRVMRTNAHVVRGLRVAGFTGGWLDSPGMAR